MRLTRIFWVLLTIVGCNLAGWVWAQNRNVSPDSASAVLGMTLADKGLVELRGETVGDFRLYTSAELSRIGWWLDATLYLYTLRGEGHDRRAMDLFALLKQNGLASFIAERHGKRPAGMSAYVEVRALHLTAIPGGLSDEAIRIED